MPQLVKGGKFVYGLSRVGENGDIVIPSQAIAEYEFKEDENVIVMSGSRKSGGFGLTKAGILEKSSLKAILERLPELANLQIPEWKTIVRQGRVFCWTTIKKGGRIDMPPETLSEYGLKPEDLLVVARGSHLAIGFVARGPIFEEARRHPELQVEPNLYARREKR